ncbi:MAG: glycosyltransferase family 2 protein [Desulfopila sp.]|jgi:glycosyltransferase involved in cell wall biosynthesis|nr:glycosyltransferase family 2 protein [Desulfopila sp.]
MVLNTIAFAVFVISFLTACDLFYGVYRMKRLSSVEFMEDLSGPLVSVIVPACNEQEHIGRTIETLLQQSYRNLEIVAVNDRSTDATGTLLEELQKKHNRLTVLHLDHLPAGWMGKSHALQEGAFRAEGDYLLFTDGDVAMDPSTISRAVYHMMEKNRDHITLIFQNSTTGLLLNSFILEAGLGLLQLFRPWRAVDKNSRNFIGVGAFNLVRRSTYSAVGGHASIRMHPVDDIMLGKRIKRSGYSQECLLGIDLVKVPWYRNLADMTNGLMKNTMATVNYHLYLVVPLLIAMILFTVMPFWGMIYCDAPARYFFAGSVAIRIVLFGYGSLLINISSWWCVPAAIITPYISVFITVRAAWLNCRDRGIFWRGTYYPLRQLRQNESLLPWF